MGWFFRKSFRLLPGIRLNLSKSGPRLSVGIPGARASVDLQGKARIYSGKGPVRFRKVLNISSSNRSGGAVQGIATFLTHALGKRQ
jgi:hypothetical protein